MRRDLAFEKDAQLDPQRIRILRRPQTTPVMPPVPETQKSSDNLPRSPTRNLDPVQPRRAIRNIGRRPELMDQRDNLRKMECELRKLINPKPQTTARPMAVKKPTDLPPVHICGIGAVGFY